MPSFRALVCLFLTLSASRAWSDTLALVGATVIDPSGEMPVFRGTVVVEEELVVAAGPIDSVPIPYGAKEINVNGKFIIPGLIDTHNHLGFGWGEVPFNPEMALTMLPKWGVTAVFDTAIPIEDLQRLKVSPPPHAARFYAVGRSMGAKDGWGGTLTGGYTPATPEEARESVREMVKAGVDGIKFVYDDMSAFGVGPWPMLEPEVMQAIIAEAHRHSLRAFVHAPILEHAKEALRAGADVLIHGIISDPVDDEFFELMKARGAYYAPTHILYEQGANKPAMGRRYQVQDARGLIDGSVYNAMWASKKQNPTTGAKLPILRDNLRRIAEAGIPVATGSDTGVNGVVLGVASQMELVMFAETGLAPIEVLRSATATAAQSIGQFDKFGSITPSKYADLVILDKDPLQDIRNIRHIWAVLVGGQFAVAPAPIGF